MNEMKKHTMLMLLFFLVVIVVVLVVGAKIRILWPILEVLFIFPLGVILLEIFGGSSAFFSRFR